MPKQFTSDISIHEKDKFFLEHAKERNYSFDLINGLILDSKGKSLGTKTKRNIIFYYCTNGKTFGIARCRAIWLSVHGYVEEGLQPSHISEDLTDDNIKNIHLTNLSMRSIESSARRLKNNKQADKIRQMFGKMTLNQVNEARIIARENSLISYQTLANKYGVSKTSMVFALQGKTWKDAQEPPVFRKKEILTEKKPRVRGPRVSKPSVKTTEKVTTEKAPIINHLVKKQVHVVDIKVKQNTEELRRIVKSILLNNNNISDFGIMKFLQMRRISFTDASIINISKSIRKEIRC